MRRALWPDSEAGEVDALLSGSDGGGARLLVHPRGSGGLGAFAEIGTRSYAEGCVSSPVAYLEGLWVDPDLRRRGVAQALVAAVERWAIAEGLQELAWDTALGNSASESFHGACGFEETDRIVCFRKRLVARE